MARFAEVAGNEDVPPGTATCRWGTGGTQFLNDAQLADAAERFEARTGPSTTQCWRVQSSPADRRQRRA